MSDFRALDEYLNEVVKDGPSGCAGSLVREEGLPTEDGPSGSVESFAVVDAVVDDSSGLSVSLDHVFTAFLSRTRSRIPLRIIAAPRKESTPQSTRSSYIRKTVTALTTSPAAVTSSPLRNMRREKGTQKPESRIKVQQILCCQKKPPGPLYQSFRAVIRLPVSDR